MNNPWNNIGAQGIHPGDSHYVTKHNNTVGKRQPGQSIRSYLSPLPYLGDLRTAPVILLGKNPTFSEIDEQDALRIPAIENENHKAMTFESDHPFFYLDERFKDTNGHHWWSTFFGEVLRACQAKGVDEVTALRRVAYAQYHPYRSVQSFVPKELFPSQEYTFHLVREAARDPKRHFVILYGAANERLWREAIPKLPTDALRVKSAQTAKLSPGNLPGSDWDQLIDWLCAAEQPADNS